MQQYSPPPPPSCTTTSTSTSAAQRSTALVTKRTARCRNQKKKKVENQGSIYWLANMQSVLQAAPAQPCRMQASWAGDTPSKHTPSPTHTSSHTHTGEKGDQQGVSVCRCFCRDELKTGGGVGCFLIALLDSTLEHEDGLSYCSSSGNYNWFCNKYGWGVLLRLLVLCLCPW